MEEQLSSKIESILFVASKPLSIKELRKTLEGSEEEIQTALDQLIESKKDSGVVILDAGSKYQMGTHSNNSEIVKNYLNADLKESLTEATTEVLSIVAYKQPISKAEIEAIRGVNSQYSLRALLMRGLIEKVPNPNDARGPAYQITTDFLQQLGISSIKELPQFEELVANITLPETPNLIDKSNQENKELTEAVNNSDSTLNQE